jgi:hypothetical protein
MARLFLVLGSSRNRFWSVLTDSVRFAYYLLLVLIKSNTFSPRHLQPAATPVFYEYHWWSNNRPTVFRRVSKKPCRNSKSPGNPPGPRWEIPVEPTTHSAESLTQKPTSPNHRLPLTAFEPTTAAQPSLREPLFMPLKRPCRRAREQRRGRVGSRPSDL